MPIIGMTNRGLAFPQIGVIRKGAPKGENHPGKDLNYFRVEFDEQEQKAKELFDEIYNKSGGKPTAMRVVFPFNNIEQVWDAWLEAYTANRLIARSDGEKIMYWKEGRDMYVKNGLATSSRTVNVWRKVDKKTEPLVIVMSEGQPVPYIEEMVFHRTEKTLVTAKPVGRLRVVLPDLKRLAYLTLTTTSVNDIIAIGGPDSGELGAIRELCRGLNLPFAGVPLILRRKPKQIAFTTADGKQGRMTRWLVHIEADPEFVEKALASSRHLAMPVVGLLKPAEEEEIINGVDEEEQEEEVPTTKIEEEDEQAVVLLDAHGEWAVDQAVKKWNCTKAYAAQELWRKIPGEGTKMSKDEIMSVIEGVK